MVGLLGKKVLWEKGCEAANVMMEFDRGSFDKFGLIERFFKS